MQLLSQDQIDDILSKHRRWMQMLDDGVQACFHGCDLTGMDFICRNLSYVDFSYSRANGTIFHASTLCNAQFKHADFAEANFEHCDLTGARMRGAYLVRSNFFNAKLRNTDLGCASLCEANLCEADLAASNFHGADLRDIRLEGTRLNWYSHQLLGEILRQHAGRDIEKLMVAGLVTNAEHLCWDSFSKLEHPQKKWAVAVLRSYCLRNSGQEIYNLQESLL